MLKSHRRNLVGIVVSPCTVAESIAHDPRFGFPLVIVLGSAIVAGWLMIPFLEAPFRRIYEATYGEDLAVGTLHAMRVYFIAVGPFMSAGIVLIRSLVFSFLLVTLVKVASERGSFSQIYAYIIHCEVVFVLMNLLTVLILELQGTDAIARPGDLIVFKGLDVLFDGDRVGGEGTRVLSNINVFTLWYLMISSTGLKIITGMERSTVILVTAAAWLFWILLDVVRDHILSFALSGLL